MIVDYLENWRIENEAEEILQKAKSLGFYNNNETTPLDQIAEIILNCNIIYQNLDQYQFGLLGIADYKQKIIWIDQSLDCYEDCNLSDEGRLNFTLAHEIGHFVLHKKLYENDNFFDFHNETDWVGRRIETQANIFAAMLMMPRKLIYQKWQKDFSYIESDHQKIFEMMNFFKTSREAMQIRLKNLNLI
jgi:Zn-dependent peptidase ImmA (M78 family)